MQKRVPIYILSGFLGSGKTTFLTKALQYEKEMGRKPALIMNEIGDVNLDGQLVDSDVPMAELLSGCICCSIRSDMEMAIRDLVQLQQPDVIWIESTGIANPLETIDVVTDAALIAPIELKSVITIIDAPQWLKVAEQPKTKTGRLMVEQIRCADTIVLNKIDLLQSERVEEAIRTLRVLNATAIIFSSTFSQIDFSELWKQTHDQHQHHHSHDHDHSHDSHHHHSHDHVMAYTHYFEHPVESEKFEQLVAALPENVFRAKGILRFTDTIDPFLFQYAYREMEFVRIAPREQVPSVVVFIGERFSKESIVEALNQLNE